METKTHVEHPVDGVLIEGRWVDEERWHEVNSIRASELVDELRRPGALVSGPRPKGAVTTGEGRNEDGAVILELVWVAGEVRDP